MQVMLQSILGIFFGNNRLGNNRLGNNRPGNNYFGNTYLGESIHKQKSKTVFIFWIYFIKK
jgi:hypothetical protein